MRHAIAKTMLFALMMPALAVGAGNGNTGNDQSRQTASSGQSQTQSKQSAPGANRQGGQPVDLSSFPRDLQQLFPLTSEERRQIRQRQQNQQSATLGPLRDVKPLKGVVRLNQSSSKIPTIKVTPDFPSSVVFTDITGKPWPIRHLAQTGSVAKVEKVSGSSNSLVFYANNHAGRKSVSVFLKGMQLPVTLTIQGDESEYHSVKNIQIAERGPNSSPLSTASSGSTRQSFNVAGTSGENSKGDGQSGDDLDRALDKMAYRVTPEGYKRIEVSDAASEAWINTNDESKLYLLTPHTISSPAPVNGAQSIMPLSEGMSLYVLPRINPVVALDETGQRNYLQFRE